MSGRYSVADAISAIKNWRTVDNGAFVTIPHSKYVLSIVNILLENKIIESAEVININDVKKSIRIGIRFNENKKNVISGFKIISKPSKKVYLGVDELVLLSRKYRASLFIVSTSRGVMTIDDAIENKHGGELICEINISFQ